MHFTCTLGLSGWLGFCEVSKGNKEWPEASDMLRACTHWGRGGGEARGGGGGSMHMIPPGGEAPRMSYGGWRGGLR